MITLNLKNGGLLELPETAIMDCHPAHKGSTVTYKVGGETKTVVVYEAVSRIEPFITGDKHE